MPRLSRVQQEALQQVRQLASSALFPEQPRCYHDIGSPTGGMLRDVLRCGWAIYCSSGDASPGSPSFLSTDRSGVRPSDSSAHGKSAALCLRSRTCEHLLDLTSSERTGVLILSPTKTVTMANPAAQAWLDLLRADERLKGAHLPTAVASAVASLSPHVQELLPHTVLVATPTGPLRIEASLASEDGSLAVTLVPQQSRIPLEVPVSWPLTRQERQVCELLLRGQSNRRIAAAVVVSENTVELHCVHVYEKLGVQNRRELLGRFFQEVRYPKLGSHWKEQR